MSYLVSRSLIKLVSTIIPLSFLFITGSISTNTNDDFIKNSCGVTMYPDLCYQTLSVYANTTAVSIEGNSTLLANAALNVTLQSAESAASYVVKMMKLSRNPKSREAAAMKDCVETLKDCVEELRESLGVMKDLEGPDFELKVSNVQTWVSAALTDEDTCLNGFDGKFTNGNNSNSVRDTLRSCLERVVQLTSITLALVNHIV